MLSTRINKSLKIFLNLEINGCLTSLDKARFLDSMWDAVFCRIKHNGSFYSGLDSIFLTVISSLHMSSNLFFKETLIPVPPIVCHEIQNLSVFPITYSNWINFGGDPGHSIFPNGWCNLLWPTTDSSAMSTVPWENKMFSLSEDSEGKIDVKCSSFPFNASIISLMSILCF